MSPFCLENNHRTFLRNGVINRQGDSFRSFKLPCMTENEPWRALPPAGVCRRDDGGHFLRHWTHRIRQPLTGL